MRNRCVAFLTALALSTASITHSQGAAAESRNATAIAYRLGVTNPYVFDVDVRLAPKEGNRDFSAAWLMLIARRDGDSLSAPFLQVGVIRDARRSFFLQGFVAVQHALAPLQYIEGEFLAPGWHRIEIRRAGGHINLFIDGLSVYSASQSAYFLANDPLYIQIGAELRANGDAIDVRWRNLRETSHGVQTNSRPSCFFDDRGLAFTQKDASEYEVVGTFDEFGRKTMRGECMMPIGH